MYATFYFSPDSSELVCRCFDVPPETPLVFRLMHHKTVIDESPSTVDSTRRWRVADLARRGGDFHVLVEVLRGRTVLSTEWQYVASDSDRRSYDKWIEEGNGKARLVLPTTAQLHKPFESIAVIRCRTGLGDDALSALYHLADELAASSECLAGRKSSRGTSIPGTGEDETTIVLTTAEKVPLPGNEARGIMGSGFALGSGVAFASGKLWRGSDVVCALTPRDASDLSDGARFLSLNSGDFLAAVWHGDGSVEFHTDYFGASAWYTYEDEYLSIIASSFLLAARVAQACGVRLSLNLATIDADFTSLTQGFQQPLFDELELSGFACIPPDRALVLPKTGRARREANQMARDLSSPRRFTVDAYDELIEAAASEVLANCAAIAKDPDITVVRCDISGGLDSRLVLAGFLAGSEDSLSKLTLYTEDPEDTSAPRDESVAVMVSMLTGVPFSEQPQSQLGPCSVPHLVATQVAATFGTYWHRSVAHAVVWDPSTVYVGGSGLDDVARDYVTGAWNIHSSRVQAPKEVSISLAQQVFKWRGKATLKAAPRSGVGQAAEQWDRLPGNEPQKASQLFNFHRARFHGGGSVPAALGAWRLAPAAARSLYLLRLMAGEILDGPRIQIELIHRLDPTLASVPYTSDAYNATYASMYGEPESDIVVDYAQLVRARKLRRSGHEWSRCERCGQGTVPNKVEAGSVVDMTLAALRELSKEPLLYELMLPAYRFARDHFGTTYPLSHSYSRTFSNKILHLYAMWQMTRSSASTLADRTSRPINSVDADRAGGAKPGDRLYGSN